MRGVKPIAAVDLPSGGAARRGCQAGQAVLPSRAEWAEGWGCGRRLGGHRRCRDGAGGAARMPAGQALTAPSRSLSPGITCAEGLGWCTVWGRGSGGAVCARVCVCGGSPGSPGEPFSNAHQRPLEGGFRPGRLGGFPSARSLGSWWASVAEEQGDAPSGFWGLGPRRGRGSRQHRAPRVWHCAPSRERTDVSVTPKGFWWLRHSALEVGKLRRRETESARLSHSPRVAGMLCPLQQLLGWGHGVAEVCGERTCSVPGARRGLLCLSPGLACAGLTSGDQPRGPPC